MGNFGIKAGNICSLSDRSSLLLLWAGSSCVCSLGCLLCKERRTLFVCTISRLLWHDIRSTVEDAVRDPEMKDQKRSSPLLRSPASIRSLPRTDVKSTVQHTRSYLRVLRKDIARPAFVTGLRGPSQYI